MALVHRLALHAAHHRHPVHRVVHFTAALALLWSLFVAAGFVPLVAAGGMEITLAHALAAGLLAYYLFLDMPFGVAAVAFFTMLLVAALRMVPLGPGTALPAAAAVASGAVVALITGRSLLERRTEEAPALLVQVAVAPLALVAETAFSLGLRAGLRDEVRRMRGPHQA